MNYNYVELINVHVLYLYRGVSLLVLSAFIKRTCDVKRERVVRVRVIMSYVHTSARKQP